MLTIRREQLQLFDAALRERIGREVVRGLEADMPHAVAGLARAEIDERLQLALAMADEHQLRLVRDLRAFLRLCFVVGPRFAGHPPVRALLRKAAHREGDRLGPLFAGMCGAEWQLAAEHDIVTRARDPLPAQRAPAGMRVEARASRGAAPPFVSLEPLATAHADDYLRHALHPDVWRLGRLRPRTSREDTVSHIRQCSTGADRQAFAITAADGRCVGAVMLRGGPALALVAYWLARPWWGRGVAGQALRQLQVLLRQQARIQRLRAEIAGANTLSSRLVERLGWTELTPAHARSLHRVFEVPV